ncbi:hypothetical protein QZH41_010600 [Actinostola sp. cb2023]|nr:hypothetical protein QZH41_010600 [Actinostola sp. cb2023]
MASKYECEHYKRRCALKAPCCGKVYACRLCHDKEQDHILDRKSVQTLKCLQCGTEQDVSSTCVKCGIHFGLYSCLKCRLFDDKEQGQFHCDECGICRVGGRENYFHCPVCAICLGTKQKDSHKCIKQGAKNNCPICMEDIHSSRIPCEIAPCGHFLHMNYSCPLCNRSVIDMKPVWRNLDQEIANTPMPDEYKNVTVEVHIKCRDCQKDSKVTFHVIGHKCEHCGSYNTSQEKMEGLPDTPLPPLPQLVVQGDQNDGDNNDDDDDEWTTEEEVEVENADSEEQDENEPRINTDDLPLD